MLRVPVGDWACVDDGRNCVCCVDLVDIGTFLLELFNNQMDAFPESMRPGQGKPFVPANAASNGWQQPQPTGGPMARPRQMPVSAGPGSSYHQSNVSTIQFAKGMVASKPGTSAPSKSGSTSNQNGAQMKRSKALVNEMERLQTWHDVPMEKKHLRKHKCAPDLFPLDTQQDEDTLTPERIKRGYVIKTLSCELSSALEKFCIENGDQTEDVLKRAAIFIQGVNQKKNEVGVINLDRKKVKDIIFQNTTKESPQQRFIQWLTDLGRGKSYHALAKRIPMLKNTEEALDLVFENRVPIQHAIWILKISHVGQTMISNSNKQKKQTSLEPGDYSQVFLRLIKDLLDKVEEDVSGARNKWKYYSMLIRNAVIEGLVDRQDFLIEICDILMDLHQKCTLDKMQLFKMMIVFASLFAREIVLNVFVARKFLYLIAFRLRGYVDEYEKKRRSRMTGKQALDELLQCVNHRQIIMTLFGLTVAIIGDCPAACVWTPFDDTQAPPCVVGSALELFPIDPVYIPSFMNESQEYTENMKKVLATRLKEVHYRSAEVDTRWALNDRRETGFQAIVHACIDVISLLDTADLCNPRALFPLYAKIFGLTKESESFEDETVTRVRAMMQWAISYERDGSHRALLVTRLLQLHVRHFQSNLFDNRTIVQIVVDFLNREGPTADSKHFRTEFENVILLLVEFQRAGLFSHSEYVQLLIRYDKIGSLTEPVVPRLKRQLEAVERAPSVDDHDNSPAIISFLPSSSEKLVKDPTEGEFCKLKDEEDDERPFMDKPEGITIHERLVVQLPIEQTADNQDAINQRLIQLYGISDERTSAKLHPRKFAAEVSKTWQKHSIRFYNKKRDIRRRNMLEQLNELLVKFRTFTFYDQMVISGICADDYTEFVRAFSAGSSYILPNMECLDMLVSMMEQAQGIGFLMQYFLEIIPIIYDCEHVLDSFRSDYTPESFSAQQGFVICGFLADHYKYFLLSKEAVRVVNGLYRLIEREIKLIGYPISCWARSIACFLAQARYDLRMHGGPAVLAFKASDCRRLLPDASTNGMQLDSLRYNARLLSDILTVPRRCMSYHDFKVRLPSLKDCDSHFSFVVNAFIAAKSFENDLEKLSELANICGHVSAVKNMAAAWIAVIEALCSPLDEKYSCQALRQLVEEAKNLGNHYTFATFITLLAARYCFSVHVLFQRLNARVLNVCVRPNAAMEILAHGDRQSQFLLTVQIIVNIVAASDEPFYLSKQEFGISSPAKGILKRCADLRCLRILSIRELDSIVLTVLTNIFLFTDHIKKEETLKNLYQFTWNAVLTITEQDWVISRIFHICHERDIDDYLSTHSGKDSVCQYLLRIALRRRSERAIKTEFIGSKGSKRALIDKLFTSLTVWNLRATYCDMRVMIKDTAPSKPKYPQQTRMVAEALMSEIGRSCRDLFMGENNTQKLKEIKAPGVEDFQFKDLHCYWLVSELLDIIHYPENVTKTIKFTFLEEVNGNFGHAGLVNQGQGQTIDEKDRVRKLKMSASLLAMQPFLNVIMVCQASEPKARDNLVSTMLAHANYMIARYREKPVEMFQPVYQVDRESLLLRLNLIGALIDFSNPAVDVISSYAITLFNVLQSGMITPERDGNYFYTCFDMAMMCVLSLFMGPGVPQYNQSGELTKSRYHDYTMFVKKLRRETVDKPLAECPHVLDQLLPIPKPTSELPTFNDTFSLTSPQKTGAKSFNGPPGYARNLKAYKVDRQAVPAQARVLRFLYHTHHLDFYMPGLLGKSLPRGSLQQHVVGPAGYELTSTPAHPIVPPNALMRNVPPNSVPFPGPGPPTRHPMPPPQHPQQQPPPQPPPHHQQQPPPHPQPPPPYMSERQPEHPPVSTMPSTSAGMPFEPPPGLPSQGAMPPHMPPSLPQPVSSHHPGHSMAGPMPPMSSMAQPPPNSMFNPMPSSQPPGVPPQAPGSFPHQMNMPRPNEPRPQLASMIQKRKANTTQANPKPSKMRKGDMPGQPGPQVPPPNGSMPGQNFFPGWNQGQPGPAPPMTSQPNMMQTNPGHMPPNTAPGPGHAHASGSFPSQPNMARRESNVRDRLSEKIHQKQAAAANNRSMAAGPSGMMGAQGMHGAGGNEGPMLNHPGAGPGGMSHGMPPNMNPGMGHPQRHPMHHQAGMMSMNHQGHQGPPHGTPEQQMGQSGMYRPQMMSQMPPGMHPGHQQGGMAPRPVHQMNMAQNYPNMRM